MKIRLECDKGQITLAELAPVRTNLWSLFRIFRGKQVKSSPRKTKVRRACFDNKQGNFSLVTCCAADYVRCVKLSFADYYVGMKCLGIG